MRTLMWAVTVMVSLSGVSCVLAAGAHARDAERSTPAGAPASPLTGSWRQATTPAPTTAPRSSYSTAVWPRATP